MGVPEEEEGCRASLTAAEVVLVGHAVRVGERFAWSERAAGLRRFLPADVVGAIDAVGCQLGPDADTDAVIAALHGRGLGFMHIIAGLMAITNASLADAKWLVHAHEALAGGRESREAAWSAMYEEFLNDPDVSEA